MVGKNRGSSIWASLRLEDGDGARAYCYEVEVLIYLGVLVSSEQLFQWCCGRARVATRVQWSIEACR